MRRLGMTLLIGIAVMALAEGAFAQQPAQPQAVPPIEFKVEVLGSKLSEFAAKMDAYAALRRSLEEGLPPLAVTDNPSDIHRAERLLAERIRKARANAGRGSIFTEDIRRSFRQLLRPVTNAGTCEAINSEYPKGKPVSTVPASILAVLPRLPEDVWYRFLDRDLILHDSRANIILDRIDIAIRCE
jgi:hypothetical protein